MFEGSNGSDACCMNEVERKIHISKNMLLSVDTGHSNRQGFCAQFLVTSFG